MIKNLGKFYSEIEKLSLYDLESKIKKYYEEFKKSNSYEDERLNICLSIRRYMINKNFAFTPNIVSQIERVNRLLSESTAKVIDRTNLLYKQMIELISNNDNFLTEFSVDGTLSIDYLNEKSILIFDEDENKGQSDYMAMADVLDYNETAFKNLVSFRHWSECLVIDEQNTYDALEYNWKHEILDVPEIGSIKYFCRASYILFTKTNYSLSDIIRIRNISNEVIVTHKNLTYE
ncbi:MAG: hypothetical protein ACOYO1_00785 [Bacteroidales bacterium]